ncbi:MAG: hypothetical protein ACFB2Y_02595 [Fulvivirga sp.]
MTIAGTILSSCAVKPKIERTLLSKGQVYFREELKPDDSRVLVAYKAEKNDIGLDNFKVGEDHKISFKSSGLDKDLKKLPSAESKLDDNPNSKNLYVYPVLGTKENNDKVLNDADSKFENHLIKNESKRIFLGETYAFKSKTDVLQAVSIPFKYRFARTGTRYRISTGVNVGIARGWKRSKTEYTPVFFRPDLAKDAKIDNHILRTRSFTFAYFGGLTVVELNAANTDETVMSDRDVLGLTAGIMYVYSINKLNLGLALGSDIGLSDDAKDWDYQYVPWLGFVFSLEFIK